MYRSTAALLASLLVVAGCSAGVTIEVVPAPSVVAPDGAAGDEGAMTTADPTADPTAVPDVPPTPEPSPTPTATPVPGELTVNDTSLVGMVGDDLLSLGEAVGLANGTLAASDLSDAEQAQSSGQPGAGTPDTIVVDTGDEDIAADGGFFWQLELFENTGDSIEGGGTRIVPSADDGEARNIMLIGSSNVSISGFVFADVEAAISIESASADLANITISGNTFVDISIEDIGLRNSVSEGSLRDVSVVDNEFIALEERTEVHRFVRVLGGVVAAAGELTDTAIDGLDISRNAFTVEGQAALECVAIHGGMVEFANEGDVSGVRVSDVTIADNAMAGCASAVLLEGATLVQNEGVASANSIDRVTITGNAISGNELDADLGIVIRGANASALPGSAADFEPPPESMTATANSVTGVTIIDNTFANLESAIVLVGGAFGVTTAGDATGNTVGAIVGEPIVVDGFGLACLEIVDDGPQASGNTLETTCEEFTG